MTQTLTTTAAFNNINSSSASSSGSYVVSEDEISKKLPKEILLRILSYLDVVSLCRCAQVSITEMCERKRKDNNSDVLRTLALIMVLLSSWDLKRVVVSSFQVLTSDVQKVVMKNKVRRTSDSWIITESDGRTSRKLNHANYHLIDSSEVHYIPIST